MKRTKKRYVVKFENINGKGSLGTFTRMNKAEHEVEMNKLNDQKEIAQGYADMKNKYWIEEITVF